MFIMPLRNCLATVLLLSLLFWGCKTKTGLADVLKIKRIDRAAIKTAFDDYLLHSPKYVSEEVCSQIDFIDFQNRKYGLYLGDSAKGTGLATTTKLFYFDYDSDGNEDVLIQTLPVLCYSKHDAESPVHFIIYNNKEQKYRAMPLSMYLNNDDVAELDSRFIRTSLNIKQMKDSLIDASLAYTQSGSWAEDHVYQCDISLKVVGNILMQVGRASIRKNED